MSTIVCQELVPCETATTTTTLKLKLAAPPITPPPSAIDLSFLQSVSTSYTPYPTKLSAKSLQLCTENLGSETGSDMIFTDDMTFFSPTKRSSPIKKKLPKSKPTSFPPPLSTSSVLRRHSEGGRLIIEAVQSTPCLQAERIDGRLRLCFSRPTETEEDSDITESESESENEIEKEIEDDEVVEVKEEIGIGKLERMRRCNGHGRIKQQANWREAAPLWVAASS